jgi:hypothetical protein
MKALVGLVALVAVAAVGGLAAYNYTTGGGCPFSDCCPGLLGSCEPSEACSQPAEPCCPLSPGEESAPCCALEGPSSPAAAPTVPEAKAGTGETSAPAPEEN